jgi:hypothetical protein
VGGEGFDGSSSSSSSESDASTVDDGGAPRLLCALRWRVCRMRERRMSRLLARLITVRAAQIRSDDVSRS